MKKITLIGCCFFLLVNGLKSQDLNKSSSSEDYISFYQKNISDLRSGSCPMYPSCSNYALETIKEQGLITGIINGSDRLLRCGHEHKYYNLTLQEKGFKLIDLPNNLKETGLIFYVEHQTHTFNSFYQDSTLNLLASLINDGLYSEALIEINKIKVAKREVGDDLVAFEMICLNALKKYDKVIYNYSLLNSQSKSNTDVIKQLFSSHLKLENYSEIIKLDSVLIAKDKNEYRVRQLFNLVFTSYLNENKLTDAHKNDGICFTFTIGLLDRILTLNLVTKFGAPEQIDLAHIIQTMVGGVMELSFRHQYGEIQKEHLII